jgi:hypothetical protein
VQRISRSPHFQKSARLRDFLTYVVGETLQGRTGSLNEHQIGCSVFERPSDYRPADDNIVRVHARQLRSRLEEYFLTDGREESILLEIPKGSYIPLFHERVVTDAVQVLSSPAPKKPAGPLVRIPRNWTLVSAVLALVSVVLAVENWELRKAVAGPSAGSMPWMLAALLDRTEAVTVVIPDSGFGALRSMLGSQSPLADYVEPGYPEGLITPGMKETDEHWVRTLTGRPYTTFPTVVIATRLAQIAERNHAKIIFRFAREMNSRDLNEGRFILIGSAIVNPWVSLFDSQLAFPSGWDAVAKRSFFRNVAPRPGEQNVYMPEAPNAVPGESFGTVSLLVRRQPASRTATTVLMIEGTNIESTEAAANFVFDAKMSQDALGIAGAPRPAAGMPRYRFEALLRTRAVSGASRDTEVAATRYSGGDRR